MSRIWDALRHAARDRMARGGSRPPDDETYQRFDRRRSERNAREVPLYVCGHSSAEGPFHEETQTLDVSDHGGRLLLMAPVRPGQKLLLTNKVTRKEVEYLVVRVAPQPPQNAVGIAFLGPAPGFWQSQA
ncbi:MAG TPA: PilZ domain-containing protein [Candidatus Acidoferrales bacterium]|nr:PilZ domain-containing protein [Candidatus Acidoferrales bacterium]